MTMNLSYVPSYLTYGPRQADGWPESTSEAVKTWAKNTLRRELDSQDAISLDYARQVLFEYAKNAPADLVRGALWDYKYAFTHRAMLAAGATQVWTLPGRYPDESQKAGPQRDK